MHSGINCNVRPADPLHINPAYQEPIEVCPYPSRQVPVKPKDDALEIAQKFAYEKGFSAALQQCREAVDNVECPDIFRYGIRLALAAISRVREGMK
jgi:hypothetical protein